MIISKRNFKKALSQIRMLLCFSRMVMMVMDKVVCKIINSINYYQFLTEIWWHLGNKTVEEQIQEHL